MAKFAAWSGVVCGGASREEREEGRQVISQGYIIQYYLVRHGRRAS